MKSPKEIAAEALRDELYARATFAKLITLSAQEFRAAIENDPRAQTEFMARHILNHVEEYNDGIPPEHGLELVTAARLAARAGEPHVRCRAEKDFAMSFSHLGRRTSAEAALQAAKELAAQTLAPLAHEPVLQFSRAVLCHAAGYANRVTRYLERAIEGFAEIGARDRADSVREFDAFRRLIRGEYISAMAAYEELARRARAQRSAAKLATTYYNIAHCHWGLSDFASARRYFSRSARLHNVTGRILPEARALRCVARTSIRIHGVSAAPQMDRPKTLFLGRGAAGEVCRSTLAIMQELLLRNPESDICPYIAQLEEEALTLGVEAEARSAVSCLNAAAREGQVNAQVLQKAWDAFGPTCEFSAISAVAMVAN